MKKEILVFLTIFFLVSFFYNSSFSTFFTQDDFILINYFSQNDLVTDIEHVFGLPVVTHWRPLHNLYFFISGNLFGKNYWLYHLFTIFIHSLGSFFVYKIFLKIFKNKSLSLIGGVLYGIHPAHFVSVFWISGGATIIGFALFASAFYYYLSKKYFTSTCLLALSFLASEAMLTGILVIFLYEFIFKGKNWNRILLVRITIISLTFVLIKLLLTPIATFDAYKFEVSDKTLTALKYYLLRIFGFAETSGDFIASLILISALLYVCVLLFKKLPEKNFLKIFVFASVIFFLGLFPFVLLPDRSSPHYMNISVWGFATIILISIKGQKFLFTYLIITLFALLGFYNIAITMGNNWVVKRSLLTWSYIERIEKEDYPPGSSIVFNDNNLSNSQEAYIVLAGGEAIKFWFEDRQYRTCFNAFEKCDTFP